MLYPTVSLDRDGAPGGELRVAVTARRGPDFRRRPGWRARWKSCAGTRAASPGDPRRRRPGSRT